MQPSSESKTLQAPAAATETRRSVSFVDQPISLEADAPAPEKRRSGSPFPEAGVRGGLAASQRNSCLAPPTEPPSASSADRRRSSSAIYRKSDSRSAVSLFMLSLFKNDVPSGITYAMDFQGEGIVRPVIAEFFENISEAVFAPEQDLDEDNLSDAEEMGEPEVVLGTLISNLTQGTNFATLACLVMVNTFTLKDRRLDKLFGHEMPQGIRQIVIIELMAAVDTLWERFGALLVQKYSNFEAAFDALDDNKSGYVDKDEFTQAFVDIQLEHAKDGDREADGTQNITESSLRRQSTAEMKESKEAKHSLQKQTQLAVPGPEEKSRQPSCDFGKMAPEPPAEASSGSPKSSRASALMTHRKSWSNFLMRKPSVAARHIGRLNRMILRAEAAFMFDMLASAGNERGLAETGRGRGERGRDSFEGDELISMQVLVMRLTGLGRQYMESLRTKLTTEYSNLQAAFRVFSKTKALELSRGEFDEMFRSVYRIVGSEARGAVAQGSAAQGSEEKKPLKIRPSLLASTEDLAEMNFRERAGRIFNGIDVDGSGYITMEELRNALAPYGDPTPFSLFRRRLLLRYGSFENFASQHPLASWRSGQKLEAFSFELDLNMTDTRNYLHKLGLDLTDTERDESTAGHWPPVPADGYTVEELTIATFLEKPEDTIIEELFNHAGTFNRDRDIPFREFADRVLGYSSSSASQHGSLGLQKVKDVARQEIVKKKGVAGIAKRTLTSHRVGSSVQGVHGILPSSTTCTREDLKHVYAVLEREHRRVSVNILRNAMTNASDFIAIDKNSYQSGETIMCRLRLSAEALKRCKERPFIAVVPDRLEWKEVASLKKGSWMLDNEKVVDLEQACGRVYELASRNGTVPRELHLRITAPSVVASTERHGVRLFASSNGKEPGRQIGHSVNFDLRLPAPHAPVVNQVSLNPNTGEARAVLHWSAPAGNFAASPILNYRVQVEPLIYPHTQIVDRDEASLTGDAASDEAAEKQKIENPANHFTEVTVWSPTVKAFTRKFSYGIRGLQRGVPYRFGVQCVHAGPKPSSGEAREEVRGTPSELSEIVQIPLFHVTEAPGAPRVFVQQDDRSLTYGMIELMWAVPSDEGPTDSNKVCNYTLQYRKVQQGSDSQSTASEGSEQLQENSDESGGDSDMSDEQDAWRRTSSASDASIRPADDPDEIGWQSIDEGLVFVSQPKFADFVGWQVACHITDLPSLSRDIDDDDDHEFRVAAVNFAGVSPWSKPSDPVELPGHATLEKPEAPQVDMSMLGLEVTEVRGMGVDQPRSQCLLRWHLPFLITVVDHPKYEVQVQETSDGRPSEAGWKSVTVFLLAAPQESKSLIKRQSSVRAQPVEAMVMGLEQFPPFAELQLKVVASSGSGTVSAQVKLPPMEIPRPAPPPGPPEVVQVVTSTAGIPFVELRWPAAAPPSSDSLPRYQVQAATVKSEGVAEPVDVDVDESDEALEQPRRQLGPWTPLEDVLVSQEGGYALGQPVRGIIRGLALERPYVFRVCVIGPFGEPGDASPSSLIPLNPSAYIANTGADERPRELQVLHGEDLWCELAWEQRVAGDKDVPTSFDAQETRDDLPEPDWQPVRMIYATPQMKKVTENGNTWLIKAILFFKDKLPCGSPHKLSFWRIRRMMRIRYKNSEWSIPTSWQQPPEQSMPPQLTVPKLVRNEQAYYVLEWTKPESEAERESTFRYELQVQHRRGGKFSDWTTVPVFTAPLGVATSPGAVSPGLMEPAVASARRPQALSFPTQALVERQAVARTAKNAKVVRFRVRLVANGGSTGLPSEPSELVSAQVSFPTVEAPPSLDIAGRGHILMEDERHDSLLEVEFVRFKWSVPIEGEEGDGDPENTAAAGSLIPPVVYDLEAEDEEHGFWVTMPGALVEVDRIAGRGSALVPLPTGNHRHIRQARFRIAAARGNRLQGWRGIDPQVTYSRPSSIIYWSKPLELENAPRIVQAEPLLLTIRFSLPDAAARPGLSTVSAVLETCSGAGAPLLGKDSSVLEEEKSTLGQACPEFQAVGEYPVYWQTAKVAAADDSSETGNGYRRGSICRVLKPSEDDPKDSIDNELAEAHRIVCEGVIVFNDAGHTCTIGDSVRVKLRISKRGEATALTSLPSDPVMVAESSSQRAVLRLKYPPIDSRQMPPDREEGIIDFSPELFIGVTAKDGDVSWQSVAASCESSALAGRLCFRPVEDTGLPAGFRSLNAETGVITLERDTFLGLQASEVLAVQVTVTKPWSAGPDNSILVTPGLTAIAQLTQTPGMVMQSLLNTSREDGDGDASCVTGKLASLLPVMGRLQAASEGSAGDAVFYLVDQVLRLPSEAISVAGNMATEELYRRIVNDVEGEDSEDEPVDASEGSDGSIAGDFELVNRIPDHLPSNGSSSAGQEADNQEGVDSACGSSLGGSPLSEDEEEQGVSDESSKKNTGLDTKTVAPKEDESEDRDRRGSIARKPGGPTEGRGRVSVTYVADEAIGRRQTVPSDTPLLGTALLSRKQHSEVLPGVPAFRRPSAVIEGAEDVGGVVEMDKEPEASWQGPGPALVGSESKRMSASRRGSMDKRSGQTGQTAQTAHVHERRRQTLNDGFFRKSSKHTSTRHSVGQSPPHSPTGERWSTDDATAEEAAQLLVGKMLSEPVKHHTGPFGGRSAPGSRVGSRRGSAREEQQHRRTIVEVSYPSMTPLWPAFTDLEFEPAIKAFPAPPRTEHQRRQGHLRNERRYVLEENSKVEDMLVLEPGQLLFAIAPPLPAKVTIDDSTGFIRGSPLMEHMAGSQYTVTVRWRDSGEVAATCAFACAVVNADLAAQCNHAFLGPDHPMLAFRHRASPSPRLPHENQSQEQGDNDASSIRPSPSVSQPNTSAQRGGRATTAQHPTMSSFGGDSAFDRSDPFGDIEAIEVGGVQLPALESATAEAESRAPSHERDLLCFRSPRRRPLTLRSRLAMQPLVGAKATSRVCVFPLGPPLHTRDMTVVKGKLFQKEAAP